MQYPNRIFVFSYGNSDMSTYFPNPKKYIYMQPLFKYNTIGFPQM